MPSFLIHHLNTIVALAICALAWAKGGPSERAGAAVVAAAWIAALVAVSANMIGPSMMMGLDAVTAAAFLILALRYSSLWLGLAMLLQAGELSLHAAFLAGDGSGNRDYIIRVNLVSTALLALLLGAVLFAWGKRAWVNRRARVATASAAQVTAPPA